MTESAGKASNTEEQFTAVRSQIELCGGFFQLYPSGDELLQFDISQQRDNAPSQATTLTTLTTRTAHLTPQEGEAITGRTQDTYRVISRICDLTWRLKSYSRDRLAVAVKSKRESHSYLLLIGIFHVFLQTHYYVKVFIISALHAAAVGGQTLNPPSLHSWVTCSNTTNNNVFICWVKNLQ